MEDFREILSKNIVALRKTKKLTQSELAEKLNYSDKTVSKWEKGDAVPDVETLISISQFFEVSIDDLVSKSIEEVSKRKTKQKIQNKRNKIIITLLSVSLVWLASIILFVQLKILNNTDYWMAFIWALPVSFVVLLIFNAVWGKRCLTFIAISFLIWTLIVSIFLQLYLVGKNIWPIFFIGIPLQVATILWSQLERKKKVTIEKEIKGDKETSQKNDV